MIKTALVLFLLFSKVIAAENCKTIDVSIIYDKKIVVTREIICTKKNSDNTLFYISKSCVDNKCEILKRKKRDLVIKDYRSNFGSPGFKLCEGLGGIPQSFEFQKESADRCLFGREDFVEISLLTAEWKRFVKTK